TPRSTTPPVDLLPRSTTPPGRPTPPTPRPPTSTTPHVHYPSGHCSPRDRSFGDCSSDHDSPGDSHPNPFQSSHSRSNPYSHPLQTPPGHPNCRSGHSCPHPDPVTHSSPHRRACANPRR
ncbi:hypothetical protein KFL_000090690, partial [Klebsormidium nitens]